MSIAAKQIPTLKVLYYVNDKEVTKRTYQLVKQSLQMMIHEPYTENKQRFSLNRYQIYTIYSIHY